MKRLLLTVAVAALVLAAGRTPAAASAASIGNLEATLQHHYGHQPGDPCSAGFNGTVAGYGAATLTCSVTSITSIPGTSCFSATYDGTIALAAGSTLSLVANGIGCPAGNSGDALGSSVSYGNPISLSGRFAITGGTGVFAGASGGGTFLDYFAGDIQMVEVNGTIS